MKYLIAISFFLCFSISKGLEKSPDVWETIILLPSKNAESVPMGQKLEIGISGPPWFKNHINDFLAGRKDNGYNPFDPDQIEVEAEFWHYKDTNYSAAPDLIRKSGGFYYQPYQRTKDGWQPLENDFIFRIRFAPPETGYWRCKLKVKLRGEVHISNESMYFTCGPSESKGEIVLNNTGDQRQRYLKYSSSNEMFFPVGMNLLWTRLDELKAEDYYKYEKWLDQLQNAKTNYIQLSSLPFTHGIEQDALNDYGTRMPQAWELDQLFELAEQKGIYINLLLLIHDEFATGQGWIHKNNHWTNNPYNKVKNNGLTAAASPNDFFSDEKCKQYFKKRLRYLLGRYGYSFNWPVIELLSEVDNAAQKYNDKSAEGIAIRKHVKTWFVEMKDYIENTLGYNQKLVSASYTQGDQSREIEERLFSVADVVLLHFYGRDKYTSYQNRYKENVEVLHKNAITRYKPVIFDEMGANVFPGLDQCADITFHNNLWATALMGSFGTGQNWWWDNSLLPNGYEKNLVGIQKFLSDENFTIKTYEHYAWLNKGTKFKNKVAFEAYYLKSTEGEKIVGWIHNTSFYWANLKNSNECIATFIKNNNGSHIEAADNSQYAKDYARGKAKGQPETKSGYKLVLTGNPGTEYIIKWYNTITGEPNGNTQIVKSSSSGKLKFDIPEITFPSNVYGDLGFKVVKFTK